MCEGHGRETGPDRGTGESVGCVCKENPPGMSDGPTALRGAFCVGRKEGCEDHIRGVKEQCRRERLEPFTLRGAEGILGASGFKCIHAAAGWGLVGDRLCAYLERSEMRGSVYI